MSQPDAYTSKEQLEKIMRTALWVHGFPINCIGLAIVAIGIIVILWAYFAHRRPPATT